MKRTMVLAALAIAMLAAGAARADYEGREIGNWVVSAKEDRFGDGGTYLALTAGDGMIFGVRCIQKDLSAAIVFAEKELKTKDLFEFKLRVDKEPVVETFGIAINEHLIEIEIQGDLIKQMREGKELAVRMKAATFTSTRIIKLRGASKAFADIVKECPIDKPANKGDTGPKSTEAGGTKSSNPAGADSEEIQKRTVTVPAGSLEGRPNRKQ